MTDDTEVPVKVVDRRWWANPVSEDGTPVPSSDWVPEKPSYVQELEQQVAEKNNLLQEYITQFKQAQQDFDDARARMRKEVARDAEQARRSVFADLLEVVDNLDRAIEAARVASADNPLLTGVEMVRQQFLHKLSSYGITRIDPLGHPFDPLRHEAVTTMPATTAYGDGIVAGVIAPGYLIGDEVLRPATVAVAKGEATTADV
jgi:molecular chaperone GrpE